MAQKTKINPWEFVATKVDIMFSAIPKVRTLIIANHLT
jgi:hypothetical protein